MDTATPGTARKKVGVLLAIFDFPMLNAGFRAAIDAQPDMEVVGQVEDRQGLRDELDRLAPDVVVAECLPFNASSRVTVETIETIRSARPAAKILAVECGTNSDQFSLAIKAGADGFLTRDAEQGDVVNAVRCITHGQTYVCPALVTKMVNTYLLRTPQGGLQDPYDSLSDREREVLVLAAVGHTNREIARIFHLSEQTVHNYRAGLMEKLGFHDRVELLKYAIRRGVVSVADL
jgi:two-component system response regulator NreC